MAQAEALSPNGVQAQSEGGTPLPLAADHSAEALDTLEFSSVLELVAAYAVGPLGATRVRSRLPTGDISWIRHEL